MDRSVFLNNLKEEATVLNNYSVIFNKMLKDDYLEDIYSCIEKIFFKEVGFAVQGIITRA